MSGAARTVTKDVGLVALFPDLHEWGKEFQYVAHVPDGERKELLSSRSSRNCSCLQRRRPRARAAAEERKT